MKLRNTYVGLLIQYSQEQTGDELDGTDRIAGFQNQILFEV
jgi:hypothetical protein